MHQYHVMGTIEYILRCPKAPGLDPCNPVAGCEGHIYPAAVDVYVDAPDGERAVDAAIRKLHSPYPWPRFGADLVVEIVGWEPTRRAVSDDRVPLPGFESALAHTDGATYTGLAITHQPPASQQWDGEVVDSLVIGAPNPHLLATPHWPPPEAAE